MKKDLLRSIWLIPGVKRLFVIMRITVFLLFLGLLQAGASTNIYSQNAKLNLSFNRASLREVVEEIERQTDFRFLFRDNTIDSKEHVTINKEGTVEEILQELFKDENVEYQLLENNLIVISIKLSGAQQQKTVSGKVTDALGVPLPGVTLINKGTTQGTITGADGSFSLSNISANATLVVSFVGMKTQEIPVQGKTIINVMLEEETFGIQEVVAVGYGTLEKKQVTSSISSVKAEDLIAGVGGASIAHALQGKVSGLIISGTDSPNSGNTLQLRGIASVNAGQSPLVVIDGMPGGDIRSVMQEDILSVDVLKDASAGAIYGTRAAAGVILITTKQGQIKENGKIKLTYTGEVSFKQERDKPEVLSAEEYRTHKRGTDYGSSVDWWDELINDNPTSQKHVVNINGGSKFAQIYSTFMYKSDKGIAIEDDRTDYGGRINANFNFLDGWLEVKTHIDYRQAKRNNNAPNFKQALWNNPTRSPYDSTSKTGYNIWTGEIYDYNVLANSKLVNYNGLDKWFKPDATVKLNILSVPGLSLQQTFAYENSQWEYNTYRSKYHQTEIEESRTGTATIGFSKTNNKSSEGYASYINSFKRNSINAIAGYSYFEYNNEGYSMTNYNFTNDLVGAWDIGEGSYLSDGEASMSSNKAITQRLFSLYARANYSYNDIYMATGTIRHEGSSKFAKNNRWGNFWSFSGGWRISKEEFMRNICIINDLKLRAGYGVTGNNNFGADYAATMYGSDQYWLLPDGTWAYTYGKTKNINDDLKWEEKHEWDLGLDYSLFNNRLYGKFDIYKRKAEGLIYNVQVSQPPYVETNMYKNIGNLENKGWEFEIGGDIIKNRDWQYSSSMNLSTNKTRLLTLWGNQTYYDYSSFPAPGSPGSAIRIEEGVEIGSFYLWKFAGFDDNGDFLLYDKDNNVIPASEKTGEDKRHLGNYMPKLIVAWNHRLNHKNWDLTVNMRSWIDFDVYNTMNMYFGLPTSSTELNLLKTAYTKYANITGEKQLCDYFLEDGTFLKIDNINLGYNLDLKKYTRFESKVRLYLTVNNVATFTKYSGIDPEVDVTGLSGGIEWFNSLYPQTRTYTLGIQLTF